MRHARIFVGDRNGSPLWLRPTTSPLTPFFWSRNVREQKVAVRSWASDALGRLSRCCPRKSCTSRASNGVESDGLLAYSPGRSRKKNANPIISAAQVKKGSIIVDATAKIRRRTWTGTGFTLLGGGSSLLYEASMRCNLKSIVPLVVRRGSTSPSWRNVWPTDRM